jgi:hypothetical protein
MNTDFLNNMRAFNINDGLALLQSGGFVTMSWGIENIISLKNGGEVSGMAFNVNGNHFKGTIILSVNFMDLYEIRFMQNGEIVDTMTDVYVMDVINQIDKKVEKIPEYVK